MAFSRDIDQKIMDAINRLPGSTLEDIAQECPDLTWNQVFVTIDNLSRQGVVRLIPKGRGLYAVHPLNNALDKADHSTPVIQSPRAKARDNSSQQVRGGRPS